MFCPHCGNEYRCPCMSCKTYNKSNWKFIKKGKLDLIQCKCGFDETMDWWHELSITVNKLK